MNWIDFRDLPSDRSAFSTLFLDYVTDYDKVRKFYNGNFRDPNDWNTLLESLSHRKLQRSALSQILTVQNRNFHCGVKTLANIDSLLNDNTYAVVTGQQVGLFTGPLYTIFKTITTIKLAERLKSQYPDHNFVPVFWLEGEDHDYEEVGAITLINQSNDLAKIEYQPQIRKQGENAGAVGQVVIDEGIHEFFKTVDGNLLQTEFKPKVLDLFRIAYQVGMTFNKAFVHLMNDLLEDSGLVFLDPHDIEFKRQLQPIFQKELEQTPRTCQLVIDQTVELEKRYQAQVKPKPINLFLFHNQGRYLIEPKDDGFGLKGSRQSFSHQQMLGLVRDHPELFSPNVVLRPLCQDWVLPTIAYVAGPSEISYFAQFRPLYGEFNIPQPIIYPRASATIVEEKVEKVLERFKLELPELFRDVEFLKRKVADQGSTVKLEELFGGTTASILETLASLSEGLKKIDPTLVGALDNARNKMEYQIDALKQKAGAAQKRLHEVAMRQVEKASLHIFPNSGFQEREINVLHFLNKYGLEFLRWLNSELAIDKFKHQIIRM